MDNAASDFRSYAAGWRKRFLPLALVVLALLLVYNDSLWRWDQVFYDACWRLWKRPPAEDILIVAIDEKSLHRLGRWPWPRRLHAELIQKLTAAGAKAVALDIVLAEPDASDPDGDQQLVRAVMMNQRVVLPVLPEQPQAGAGLVETRPLPALAAMAAGLGHVDLEFDRDGITRSVFLYAGLDQARWPHLARALLAVVEPRFSHHPLPHDNSEHDSPPVWERDQRLLVPFAGPPGHFRRVSYVDVLSGAVAPAALRDKLILVGGTALGMGDKVATPVSGHSLRMPGVEFVANVIDMLRRDLVIQPLALPWRLPLTAGLVLLPLLIFPRIGTRWGPLLLALIPIISVCLLHSLHLWYGPASALLALGLGILLMSGQQLERVLRTLFSERNRAKITLQSIGEAVISTDAEAKIQYMNPLAEQLTGYTMADAKGRAIGQVVHLLESKSGQTLELPATEHLKQGGVFRFPDNSQLVHRNGEIRLIRASLAPIVDPSGSPQGFVLAAGDTTKTYRMARQIEFQVSHDLLTKLPNRRLLQQQVDRAIAQTRRTGHQAAVLLIGLDRFKMINNSLGHAAGDDLLKAVAERLQASIHEHDTIARLDGEEFVVVLEDVVRRAQAGAVAHKLLRTFARPFTVNRQELFVSASLGISLFPGDGQDAQMLLQRAAVAMSLCQRETTNSCRFYSYGMEAEAEEDLAIERGLRRALAQQEFELHYQPQIALQDGRLVGAETLLRWRDPQYGPISPARFIPLAERIGLIESLGEWVIAAACRQAKIWHEENPSATPRLAVNLSPPQFLQQGLPGFIQRILDENGLGGEALEIEITETVIMKDLDGAADTVNTLKNMGIKLALDDFGTGYSNLSYLSRLPIDKLKIDRSFVRNITTEPNNAAIVSAIIAMAHSLSLKVIAEGVENQAQLDFLRARGCDQIQGYFIARPLPAADFTAIMHRRGVTATPASTVQMIAGAYTH